MLILASLDYYFLTVVSPHVSILFALPSRALHTFWFYERARFEITIYMGRF